CAVAERLAERDEHVPMQRRIDRRFRHRVALHAIHPLLRIQHRHELAVAPHLEFPFDGVEVRALYIANALERELVAARLPRTSGPPAAIELDVERGRHGRTENEEPDAEVRE